MFDIQITQVISGISGVICAVVFLVYMKKNYWLDTEYWVKHNDSGRSGFHCPPNEANFWASLDRYTVLGRQTCWRLIPVATKA